MAQTACVVLSTAEREQLAAIAADRANISSGPTSANRAPAQRITQSVGVSGPTVWRWEQRFAESGVDGLLRDKTRKPGKVPLAAETTARVVRYDRFYPASLRRRSINEAHRVQRVKTPVRNS